MGRQYITDLLSRRHDKTYPPPAAIEDGSRESLDWPLGHRTLVRSRWYIRIFSDSKFIAAFGLAIALTAKDHSWYRNLDTVDPAATSYVAIPDILTYNVFIVKTCLAGV